MRKIWLFALAFICIANAKCVCKCVNGKIEAIYDNILDLPSIYPLTLCPLLTPKLALLKVLSLPPIGTTECKEEQVYNSYLGDYEWKEICR